MRRRSILWSLVMLLISTLTSGQKLNSQEKKIIKIVDENMKQAFSFLEKTVNINSGTFNQEGVRSVGAVYKKELEALGFDTRWIEMPSGMGRAGHLFAERKGTTGKRILLIGHLDTVFEPDSPFQRYMLHDTIATGPGTSDMKGGNMVMLFALKALFVAKQLENARIIIALHGDEENAGDPLEVSRKDIIDAARRSDVALAFENATGFNYATVARRGSSNWRLMVKGQQAHSSLIFTKRVGAGAIYETARILHQFYNELQEELLTFNPGLVVGGTTVMTDSAGTGGNAVGKDNIVANSVVVSGDLRFISDQQKERARDKMRLIVQKNLPNTSAEISFEDRYPAMSPTEGNFRLLQLLSSVSQDMGKGEVKAFDPGKRGAGDISFIAQYVDALDGLGVMGGGEHSPAEFMNVTTADELIKRTAVFIYRLIHQ